ncbi:MAG: hypothetical protein KDC66_07775 [Phaeodactylibacter sp.]|nr:hypothetical protein [Phaeodactylibacter sp.]MCB9274808.1 hypothetical protein [Lewinellaceae bacterium]
MKPKALLPALFCILLFAYCAARVTLLSMTHDESTTVLMFASKPWGQILANEPPSANNHILNTLLVKLFTLGGLHKVLVRLPNLLAGALFLFFTYRMATEDEKRPAWQLAGLALLAFNPYLLEFFGLARGYGLSLGFQMGSLFFARRYIREPSSGALAWSLLLAVAGAYSNFTLLNYFVALCLALNVMLLRNQRKERRASWLAANGQILLFSLLLLVLLYLPVKANLAAGAFYYGGQKGFFADTFASLTEHFISNRAYLGKHTATICTWATALLAIGAAGRHLWLWLQRRRADSGAFFSFLLGAMALSTIIQHAWLGTPYLTGRTALSFYPLMALAIWELLRATPAWAAWALTALLTANLLANANLVQSQDWWYDRYTESLTRYVAAQRQEGQHIRFGASWLFVPTIQYYRKAWGIGFFIGPNMDREVPTDKYFDYYYLHRDETAKLHPDYVPEKDFGEYRLMKLPPEKKEKPGEE